MRIRFLYLALNETKDQCKLVLNTKDAFFVKQNKISAIPKDMLFDNKRKLINVTAPRPSDINILTSN